jgi:hypothetical protein
VDPPAGRDGGDRRAADRADRMRVHADQPPPREQRFGVVRAPGGRPAPGQAQ